MRGSTALCWTRRAEAARVLPFWQVPTADPWNRPLQATPRPITSEGRGSGRRGASPLGSRACCSLSPDWEWAGPVLSGPQFPRPPSGDRRLHLPGRLC